MGWCDVGSLTTRALRERRRWAAPLLFSLVAACATQDASGKVRHLPPAALFVLVDAPPARPGGPANSAPGDPVRAEWVRMIAAELRRLDASSRVVTRAELGNDRPDLVVTLVAKGPPQFQHTGASSVLLSCGLWLTTWIGGLLVPDSSYRLDWNAGYRLEPTSMSAAAALDQPIQSREVVLSFFERNDLVSGPTLQSLVLPPFWTTDQTDKTNAALERAAMRAAALELATFLKQDFEGAANATWLCSVDVKQPRNGQRVTGAEMDVEVLVISRTRTDAERVTAAVNDGPEIELSREQTSDGAGTLARGKLRGLRPDAENRVRLRVFTDKEFTRTLRLASAGT